MKITRKAFSDLSEIILEGGAKRATKYFSEKLIVRATRRSGLDKRHSTVEILFTIGKPNYRERQFIKLCKRAGEKFPLKKIQILWPR